MVKKFLLLLNTVKYLKFKQLKYQVIYRLNKPRKLHAYISSKEVEKNGKLLFSCYPPFYKSYDESLKTFSFLNLRFKFKASVDWNYQGYGKLWNYNLQYLNFIHQKDLSFDVRKGFVISLYNSILDDRLKLEPYPASLRVINVLRFVNDYPSFDERTKIIKYIYGEVKFINSRLEYHLLANHLLENLFALLMGGAFYFNNKWVSKAESLLKKELNEQILCDGAHFELSPMYHQIILFRLLELIDWYSNWENKNENFLKFLVAKAKLMLGWLAQMTFKNGEIPNFNDSSKGIAYSSKWLSHYGNILGLRPVEIPLSLSGYRAFNYEDYECRVDVGPIGASYQPGHAHADMLNFVLNVGSKPIIVDNGTSTYEIGERRNFERGTIGHNTVTINGSNQSQIWGGFRVAKRANILIVEESENSIKALHDGYKSVNGAIHRRAFEFHPDKIIIIDEILNDNDCDCIAFARFYLDPCCFEKGNIKTPTFMAFSNCINVELIPYLLSDGYNKYKESYYFEVQFSNYLVTTIDIIKIK